MLLYPNEPIHNDTNSEELLEVVLDGHRVCTGLIPRDYSKNPVGCYRAAPAWDSNMKIIPREEWSSRIIDMEQSRTRLSDFRMTGNAGQPIPSLDQNGQGYCWTHSVTSCNMILRATANMPYVRLSAHAVACMIKNFRDEGGWNPLALDFIRDKGQPSVAFWAEKSMSRGNDNPATWANALLHRVTEGFVDLNASVYDRNLTFDQVVTLLLSRIPVAGDFNWWGHSVGLLDVVEVDSSLKLSDANRWGIREWNSWSDRWGAQGMSVLVGRKAIPNGATAPRATTASAA